MKPKEVHPAWLALGAGERPGEVADDRDDDDGDAVVADRAGEGAKGGVGGTFVGVGGQRRDHAPVGDVTQGVEHVKHDERDDEQHDEQRGVHVDQSEHAGEDEHDQHGGDQSADELPRAETAPLGGGVIHEVAQQRIDEDSGDADND